MTGEQLAHILRAASNIVPEDPVMLVIGSQSVLATHDEEELPPLATASVEVDVAYFDDPKEAKADRVDAAIGELSACHETFGIYAQASASPLQSCPRAGATASSHGPTRRRGRAGRCSSSRTTA